MPRSRRAAELVPPPFDRAGLQRTVADVRLRLEEPPAALFASARELLAGAGVALVVNDSGVVTAATTMIYVVMVLGHTMLTDPTG